MGSWPGQASAPNRHAYPNVTRTSLSYQIPGRIMACGRLLWTIGGWIKSTTLGRSTRRLKIESNFGI
jgi:hypothetical protein